MLDTLRQTRTLALLTLRYWARAGVPNRLRKDQGRRASGAVLRAAFLVLMTNWGYRIGVGCARVDHEHRPAAVGWLLVGLTSLAVTWGAMGRGPGMRAPQSVLMAPLLDALPLRESSRVTVGLLERVILYALATAAVLAVVPQVRVDALLLGLALPTAGLLTGDALLRTVRTVVSPMRMGKLSMVVLVLQFPSFMLVGAAPVLAKSPRISALLAPLLPSTSALVEHGSVLVFLLASFGVALVAALVIRLVERVGYDRVDIVPNHRFAAARPGELDLVRVEQVLARREPGGGWLVRGAFFYTAATSVGLLLLARLSTSFPADSAAAFVRTLAYVGIFSGFAVVQARALRLVLRDASARPMLAPLPITPRDLLRGKTRGLMIQALIVMSPYFVLLAMPGPASLRVEVLWRATAAVLALVFAAGAAVSVAFLTQGLGGVKVLGGSLGIETTLIGMPLLAVAAAPYPWSAGVSVLSIAMLAYEARRSALRCVRWIDDDGEQDHETVVWRALLVYASFQATQTLIRRLLQFAPLDDIAQLALALAVASLVLLALTYFGRRGLPRMPVFPRRLTVVWLLVAVVSGVVTGLVTVGYWVGLRALGVDFVIGTLTGDRRIAVVASVLVLEPIAEEIFFRGWLQDAISGELAPARRWLAPLFGAFAFAALRPPLSFAPLLLLGVVCGVLHARSRSLAVCIVAHAVCFVVPLVARALLGTP